MKIIERLKKDTKKILLFSFLLLFIGTVNAANNYKVSAWTWGDPESFNNATNKGAINQVNTVWYFSQANGKIKIVDENRTFIKKAHSKGIKVLATISNYNLQTGDFDPRIANKILSKSSSRSYHVSKIYDLCKSRGYDGIDLDWESLYPSDRSRFTSFVTLLAQKLHKSRKILSIAVHPKTSEPGNWDGPKAQDWRRLGAVVDEFKIMTYDYSGSWSDPGPIAPPNWVDQVLRFAKTVVPRSKIMMGVPFYGRDWKGRLTTDLTWKQTQQLISTYNPIVRTDVSGEATFVYQDPSGANHVVYFQDCASISIKLSVLTGNHPSIRGIAIWVMGDEDPTFWDEIALKLKS